MVFNHVDLFNRLSGAIPPLSIRLARSLLSQANIGTSVQDSALVRDLDSALAKRILLNDDASDGTSEDLPSGDVVVELADACSMMDKRLFSRLSF